MATFLDNAPAEQRATASWIAGACSVAAQKAVAAAPPAGLRPQLLLHRLVHRGPFALARAGLARRLTQGA